MVLKNSKEHSWLQCLRNFSFGKTKNETFVFSQDTLNKITGSKYSTDSLYLSCFELMNQFTVIAKKYRSRSLSNLLNEIVWSDLWECFELDYLIYSHKNWQPLSKEERKKLDCIVVQTLKNQSLAILPYESKWECLLNDTNTNRSGVAVSHYFIVDLTAQLHKAGFISDEAFTYMTSLGGYYIHEFQGVAIVNRNDNADSLYHEILHHLHLSASEELKDIMYGDDPLIVHEEILTHLHTDRVELFVKLNDYIHHNLSDFLNGKSVIDSTVNKSATKNDDSFARKLASGRREANTQLDLVVGMHQSFKNIQEIYLGNESNIDIKKCASYQRMLSVQSKLESQLKELNTK